MNYNWNVPPTSVGAWGSSMSWLQGGVPGASDTALFSTPGGGQVTGDGTALQATFTGGGPWTYSGGTLTLEEAGIAPLVVATALTISAATVLAPGGTIDVGGADGPGSVTVVGGGTLDSASLSVGDVGGSGSLTIGNSAAGGAPASVSLSLTNEDSSKDGPAPTTLFVGSGGGSSGTLDVTNDGTFGVANTAPLFSVMYFDFYVGDFSAGSLTVAGERATFSTGGNPLYLGADSTGDGSLTVGQGGTVSVANQLGGDALSLGDEGTASAVVSGGSLDAAGVVVVGDYGTGTLTVEAGGSVAAQGFSVGSSPGGSGAATVTGKGSTLTNVSDALGGFYIGDRGVGSLSVLAGGSVSTVGQSADVGDEPGASDSSLGVAGAGSSFTAAGTLEIGAGGKGSLSVSAGGVVSAGSLDVGLNTSGMGQVAVSGVGSLLDVAETEFTVGAVITVGDAAQGAMSVSAGGAVSTGTLDVGSQTSSSGQLAVTGAGSMLDVTGLAYVGDFGAGGLTVSNGGAVSVGGTLDVASDPYSSGDVDVGDGGGLSVGGDLDLGEAGATAATFTLDGGGTLHVGGLISVGVNATFVQNGALDPDVDLAGAYKLGSTFGGAFTFVGVAGTVELGSGAQIASDGDAPSAFVTPANASGQVLMAAGADVAVLATFGTGVGLAFGGSTGVILLEAGGSFDGEVTQFARGDVIAVAGATGGTFDAATEVFTVTGAGGTVLDAIRFAPGAVPVGGVEFGTDVVSCLLEGTRLATPDGPRPVEALREGDLVCVAGSGVRTVVWVGRRRADASRHPRPEAVLPVRVMAGAFGPGLPCRDLFLSPDHAVLCDGWLVPVRHLVDGVSVSVERSLRDPLYFHVELDAHDAVLAEGLPVESFLDTGGKSQFKAGGGCLSLRCVSLHPDFSTRVWEAEGFAPLAVTAVAVDRARAKLRESAGPPAEECRKAA